MQTTCAVALLLLHAHQAHPAPGPPPGISSLRPKQPYRAWAFHDAMPDSPWPVLPPDLYPGANLDLVPTASNISACRDENDRGIATLHWAYGPDSPWAPKLPGGGVNQSAAASYFMDYVSPLTSPSDNVTDWAFGGAAIDEWNQGPPPSSPPTNPLRPTPAAEPLR